MSKPTAADRLAEIRDIKEKCEQYWNEPNIPDAEIHAALEFIYSKAATLNSIIDARDKELELVKAELISAQKWMNMFCDEVISSDMATSGAEPSNYCRFCETKDGHESFCRVGQYVANLQGSKE